MLKNKKALVMSVLCAIASVGFVMSASAEDVAHGNLDEVVVEGSADVLPGGMVSKTGSVGIIGDKDVEANTVSVRHRKNGDMGAMKIEEFLNIALEEIETKAINI